MVISAGAKVIMSEGAGEPFLEGVLSEDITISLKSHFKDLFSSLPDDWQKMADGVAALGSVVRDLSGHGFSMKFKQATAQVWDKTDPMRISLILEIHRTLNRSDTEVKGANIMETVKKLCSISLPGETFGGEGWTSYIGMLSPPGPSYLSAFGAEFGKVSGYVNMTIGNMKFNQMMVESADPTFSKYTDDSGYPISCKIACTFVGIWAATKNVINW